MITSIQNPLIKEIRKLHTSKGRQEQGLFLLEGRHLISEACAQNYPLTTFCCTLEWSEKYAQLWEKVALQAQRVELVSDRVLAAIATTVNPDGAIATAPRIVNKPIPTTSLGLALETVQDPGNLGTMIRTAAAAGVDSLWVSEDSVELDHPKVLRSSAGAWFRLPLGVTTDLKSEVLRCQNQGMQVLATLPNASLTYWEVDLRVPTLIILGNEGAGLSEDLIDLASLQVQIPLSRGVESLNVAIAAALILYEAQRQRRIKDEK
ncbi:rRNA methyltransferase [Oscillatoriales cyanobacterium USR001]|nr:rRNA methyltransferase [Oscillatoriales cyanobacterium USR001]